MVQSDSTEFSPGTGLERLNPVLYDALLASCEAYWAAMPPEKMKYCRDGDKEAFVSRELTFVEKVHAAMTDLAATHPAPITLLFDVDETIVKNEYGEDDSITMHVRPGLSILLQALDASLGNGYDVGLLTSRAQQHLDEELHTPQYKYLQSFGHRLNPEFVISSRHGSPIYERPALQTAPTAFVHGENVIAANAIRSIMRPELMEPVITDDWSAVSALVPRGHWYDSKLAILAHLAEQHPDRGFVFVDDLPFPAAIDPNHPQVRGVTLDNAAFRLR